LATGNGVRSRLLVSVAVALLAAAAIVVITTGSERGGSSDVAPRPSANPEAVDRGDSAFAAGRGATDPGAAAETAGTKLDGESALDAALAGVPDLKPCTLLSAGTVDQAIGSDWRAQAYGANATLRCRWMNQSEASGGAPASELALTISGSQLFDRATAAIGGDALPGVGDAAVVREERSSGFVAVRQGRTALFLALSSNRGISEQQLAAMAQEALHRLPRGH
jgi:hypothetical protein